MKKLSQLFRLFHINYVLAKHGLDNVILSIRLFSPLRFLIYLNPYNWFRRKDFSRGQAVKNALEELGPIFVKFGQALSTRRDILPDDIASELAILQDNVAPFPSHTSRRIIEREFGQSISDIFEVFEDRPLGTASIAQVHAATLKDGSDVVVKVLRPNMRKIILRDIELLKTIAHLAETYWDEGPRLKPKQVVHEFEINLLDELDLMREAANGSQLRRNFEDSELLYVPKIYWDYVKPKAIVMERIHGIPISDVAQLNEHNVNIEKLAARGVEIFFTQVFRDCYFHADMHPGNIFVSYENPQNPRYICIDFGIIGTLCDSDKRYLAENLYAFFKRDYRRVAELHIESGWVPANTREGDFESAIRTVCEPIFQRPLKDISFGQVVLQLFQTARRFHMEVQPQLILLQKTLLAIEGLGRHLYPDLDLWATAQPFLERWIKEQIGPKAFMQKMQESLPFWAEQFPQMPKLLYDVLQLQKQQMAERSLIAPQQESQHEHGSSQALCVLGGALLFAPASILLWQHYPVWDHLPWFATGSGLLGVISLLAASIKR